MGPECRSCVILLGKDPEGGGEAGGSRSPIHCSHCYENGAFRHSGASFAGFQSHCADALEANGMPRILAWAFIRRMGRLERGRGA